MDCPHCGSENLIGARICAACGRNMSAAPAFRSAATLPEFQPPKSRAADPPRSAARPPDGDEPARPVLSVGFREVEPPAAPPPPAPQEPVQALCRVCLTGYDRPAHEEGPATCPGCRQAVPAGGDPGENEYRFLPATEERPDLETRLGAASLRPRPAKRRAELRRGPIAIAVGGLLVVLTFAVVTFTGGDDVRTERLLEDLDRAAATVTVRPDEEAVTEFESKATFAILRESVRSSFGSGLTATLDVAQSHTQTFQLAVVRREREGRVADVISECVLTDQTGTARGTDARELELHPWARHRGRVRVLVPRSRPVTVLGEDSRPVPTRDAPPFMTAGEVGTPDHELSPGARWSATLPLPVTADREGRLILLDLAAEVTYVGQRFVAGRRCAALRVVATPPRRLPAKLGDMNRSGGVLNAALFYDVATGMLVDGEADFDLSAWLERGRVEDRVSVRGTFSVRRR